MKNKNTLKHFTQTIIKGLFWLLPIVLIAVLILWIYNKIDALVKFSLNFVGFSPENSVAGRYMNILGGSKYNISQVKNQSDAKNITLPNIFSTFEKKQ